MMNSYKCLVKTIAILSSLFLLTACSSDRAVSRGSQGNKVEDTIQGQIQKENASSGGPTGQSGARDQKEQAGSGTSGSKETGQEKDLKSVDLDLTKMGKDMVYANVFQMMTEPDKFIGKRVKIAGILNVVPVEGQNYYCCIIKDAQGCCQNGIEFVWGDGSHKYPEEYPKEDAEICVTGVFETYQENGGQNKYCRLRDADLNW